MAVYNDLRPIQLPLAQLEVGQKRRRNQPSNQSLQGYSCIQWQAVTDTEINAAASAASNVEFIRDLLAELSLFSSADAGITQSDCLSVDMFFQCQY